MSLYSRLTLIIFQIIILTWEELRDILFRRRALLCILLYVIGVGGIIAGIGYLESQMTVKLAQISNPEAQMAVIRDLMYQHGLQREYELMMALGKLPGAIVLMHIFTLLWLPTFVALVSCDMVATDLYRGTLRYLVVRTSRGAYYVSKLIAHFILYVILQIFALGGVFLICVQKAKDFNFENYFSATMVFFSIFLPYLWFLLATTIFISTLSAKPARTIMKLHLVWIAFLVLAYFSPDATPFSTEVVLGLVTPFFGLGIKSAVVLSLWAFGFSAAGFVYLWRRSV